jgi:hypothetical protein
MDNNQLAKIEDNIKKSLENFDKYYINYEEKLINELLCIEKKGKKHLIDIINIEKELTNYEKKYMKGKNIYMINSENDKEYNKIREKFIKSINHLNLIANDKGKGRNDLDIEILYRAEKVLCTVSEMQSLGLRNLAKEVIETINSFRFLFQNYDKYLDEIDPILANNPELVDLLSYWEEIWEKGQKYLNNTEYFKKLLHFNKIVNVIFEKYKEHNFRSLFEKKDPEIFINIPSILILDAVDRHSNEIIEEYIPDLKNNELFINIKNKIKKVYKEMKDKCLSYTLLEKLILFKNIENSDFYTESFKKINKILTEEEINAFIRDIRALSLILQRTNPNNWNEFLELAMNIEKEKETK